MNTIIDELFNKVFESENINDNNYVITTKKAYELEKALLSELNDIQAARLKEFINLQMEINLIEGKEYFIAGCKFATKYILQIME